MRREFEAPEGTQERVDKLLPALCAELTRSGLTRLFEQGLVLVNDRPADKKTKVKGGDKISVDIPEPRPLEVQAEEIPLHIVYEDDQLLVVNKPQGMVVHPAAGNTEGTLVSALLHHCGDSLSGINGVIRPGIVHRIDKDTSGLLIVAKTNAAHLHLAGQIKEHSFTRIYEAIVYGKLKEESGDINAPIGRHKTKRKQMCVTTEHSREARTHYEVIEQLDGFCHVKCQLYTGRTHQIRVHMAYIGHPVAGDPVYGPAKDKTGQRGQLLHAKTIGFVHPTTGAYLEFTSQTPQRFMDFMKKHRR